MNELQQAHIFYAGKVQGIGFRYTAKSFAKELGLTGWVKNLNDGRVELVIEGDVSKLEQLQKMLMDQFGIYIVNADVRLQKAQGKFQDFSVVS